MTRLVLDPTVKRVTVDGFSFPLGAYPVEAMKPKAGYAVEFEAADGGETFWYGGSPTGEGAEEWEEWPDRFMYDVVLTAERVPALCRVLFSLLPGRIYPILDVLGHDAYREVDPYIAYDLVGIEHFYDALRDYGPWLYEDGLVGFGAMSTDPFVYLFLDEHKVLTLRVNLDLKEKVEKLLAAFDLEPTPEVRACDSASHEHRSVLLGPDADATAISADEIIEHLRDSWRLQLNVDWSRNVDDEGRELGVTGWRCMVRCRRGDRQGEEVYAEVLLTADCLATADRLAGEAVGEGPPDGGEWDEVSVITHERLTPEELAEALGKAGAPSMDSSSVHMVRW